MDRREQLAGIARLKAIEVELARVHAREQQLAAERHELLATFLATGEWTFSALSLECGKHRTHFAVTFGRVARAARKRRVKEEGHGKGRPQRR